MINWKVVEAKGYAHYVEQGYRVLVSLIDNSGYDFVTEFDGEFKRVNVKMAGLKNKRDARSWSISRSGSSAVVDDGATCDIFLVYLPSVDRFIELTGDFFEGSRSRSKIIPKTHIMEVHNGKA